MAGEEKVHLTPQPGEIGYTPPAELVPVPSKGKIYPAGTPLAGAETLSIRAMTAREEDILTSRALIKQGKALDALLRSCVVDKSVDVDQMLSGDRNAVLIALRITGYGKDYRTKVNCPQCETDFETVFNLIGLPLKPLDVDPTRPGANEFVMRLPVSAKNVVFRLPTGSDERELSVTAERNKKSGQQEQLVTSRLLQQIVSVDGVTDRQKISQFVRTMPARDSRELRLYMDKISPGVEMRQNARCTSCGEESEVDVPIGVEFFWPSA